MFCEGSKTFLSSVDSVGVSVMSSERRDDMRWTHTVTMLPLIPTPPHQLLPPPFPHPISHSLAAACVFTSFLYRNCEPCTITPPSTHPPSPPSPLLPSTHPTTTTPPTSEGKKNTTTTTQQTIKVSKNNTVTPLTPQKQLASQY